MLHTHLRSPYGYPIVLMTYKPMLESIFGYKVFITVIINFRYFLKTFWAEQCRWVERLTCGRAKTRPWRYHKAVFDYKVRNGRKIIHTSLSRYNIFVDYVLELGARGSVVGWGIMLQAGRTRDRDQMRWIFSIYLVFPAALWPWVRLSL
jgi:hypothetical protein